jgi:hypothetical protein
LLQLPFKERGQGEKGIGEVHGSWVTGASKRFKTKAQSTNIRVSAEEQTTK